MYNIERILRVKNAAKDKRQIVLLLSLLLENVEEKHQCQGT
jgi:hypothetical protein